MRRRTPQAAWRSMRGPSLCSGRQHVSQWRIAHESITTVDFVDRGILAVPLVAKVVLSQLREGVARPNLSSGFQQDPDTQPDQ
jgi:hypothetical protein